MRSNTLGGQYKNRIMANPSHDNYSRERFVQEYIWKMNTSFHKGLNSLYKNKTKPTDGDELRPNELRKKLLGHPYGQMWSSLRRIAREWTCEAVGPTVEMQIETLIERSTFYQQNNKKTHWVRVILKKRVVSLVQRFFPIRDPNNAHLTLPIIRVKNA